MTARLFGDDRPVAGWPARLRFAPGNNILYEQDFRCWRGLPAGVTFTVFDGLHDFVRLQGRGYGAPGAYGNGSLSVQKGRIPGAVCIRVDGQDVWRYVGPRDEEADG
jgi:hypothetical protein